MTMSRPPSRPSSGLLLDRREVFAGAAALGLGLGAFGAPARAADTPRKGGTLRLGMEGGSASSSLDPRTFDDSIPISYGWQLYNCLVEIAPDGSAQGEPAESFEPRPGFASWVFNLRKGITFTSGKTMDADDVLYSINLHRGDIKSGAKDLLAEIRDVKNLTPNQIEVTLAGPNVDFPFVFADYHVVVVPNGFTAWNKPDGTGAYTLESFQPGIRVLTKSKGAYWKPGQGNFDAVDLRFIADPGART